MNFNMIAYMIMIVLLTASVTIFLRAFPFLAFARGGKPPELIVKLGALIAPAAIAMLVVFCYCGYFQDKTISECNYAVPEIAATAVVVGFHLAMKNPLLSILAGTVTYMFLLQYFC